MSRQEILLLNTLESRELKKNGKITVSRKGYNVTLSFDKKRDPQTVIESVESIGVVWVDPYTIKYDVKLTQQESKIYNEKKEVVIVRANDTFLLKDGVCIPLVSFKDVYVR